MSLVFLQEVVDNSGGCGQMFEVIIVSPLFKDKRTLARHRLVNDSLKDEISKVHAFSQVNVYFEIIHL
jgi:stress-induced morphogen